MALFSPHQLSNPRANVFILVNLGCEMLYVIDQRLKAQQIAHDKSVQGKEFREVRNYDHKII